MQVVFVSFTYSTKGWSKVKQQRRLVWTCLILWDPTCNSIGVNLAQYQEGQSAKKVGHLVKKWDMPDQNVYILLNKVLGIFGGVAGYKKWF